MKTLHIIFISVLLMAVSGAGFSQNAAKLARLHIYNTVARGIRSNATIQPYPENSQTIDIPNNRYVLIESAQDSLAFMSGKKVMYLQLEREKNCYLIITQPNAGAENIFRIKMVSEVTEREFKWTLLVNDKSVVPYKTYHF